MSASLNVTAYSSTESKGFQKHFNAIKFRIKNGLSFPKGTSDFFKGKLGGNDLEDIKTEYNYLEPINIGNRRIVFAYLKSLGLDLKAFQIDDYWVIIESNNQTIDLLRVERDWYYNVCTKIITTLNNVTKKDCKIVASINKRIDNSIPLIMFLEQSVMENEHLINGNYGSVTIKDEVKYCPNCGKSSCCGDYS